MTDADLPDGTVTFLLTDVEGSTRLWAADQASMREALARHDGLIEKAVDRNHGRLIKTRGEGDGTFSVFPRASDGVRAACDIQRDLAGEHWPPGAVIRVRAALHTGEAELRDGDYYGLAINRAARLRALAHGGQTLLSMATYNVIHDGLPSDCEITSVGVQTLRDFDRPQEVYQLSAPDLPSAFPPVGGAELSASSGGPEIRISDSDRQDVVTTLREHTTRGYLTLDEFSARVGAVWASRFRSDLDAVLGDLPVAQARGQVPVPVGGGPPALRRPRVRRAVAIFGNHEQRDRWRIEGEASAWAVFGGCVIDLRQAEIDGEEIVIRANAVFGGIEVIVPEGIDVTLSGFSLFGGRKAQIAEGPVLPGTPRVHVKAHAIFGGIDVKSKPPPDVERARRDQRREQKLEERARRKLDRG